MKNRVFSAGFIGLFLWGMGPALWADSTSEGPINVSAVVPNDLTLEIHIVDQLSSAEKPSLDFGELERVGGEFRAKTFYKVLLTVSGAGDPFELTQNGSALTRSDGTETIPSGAYMMRPGYSETENEGQARPLGSALGDKNTAVGPHLIYSDPTGSQRVTSATYTLSGDPSTEATEVIPLSQKSGTYSGTIQFTLTTT